MAKPKKRATRSQIKRFRASGGLGEAAKPFPGWLAGTIAVGVALVAFAVIRTASSDA